MNHQKLNTLECWGFDLYTGKIDNLLRKIERLERQKWLRIWKEREKRDGVFCAERRRCGRGL